MSEMDKERPEEESPKVEGRTEEVPGGAAGGKRERNPRKRPRQSGRRRKRGRSRRRKMTPPLAAAIFITIVVLFALLSIVIRKYSPSKERADLNSYYNVQSEEDLAVIMDGKRLEETAKYWDGCVYMDYKTVQKYLNQRFYWDSNENILRYTTNSDLISVNAGEKSYAVTKKNENVDYVIVKVDGENI